MLSARRLAEEHNVLPRFMESAMERMAKILIHLHAVEQALISKGVVTEDELQTLVRGAEGLPIQNLGMRVLQEMLNEYKKENTDEKDSGSVR